MIINEYLIQYNSNLCHLLSTLPNTQYIVQLKKHNNKQIIYHMGSSTTIEYLKYMKCSKQYFNCIEIMIRGMFIIFMSPHIIILITMSSILLSLANSMLI